MISRRVIVIGAGASGMMAAGKAAESGAQVLLLEKTDNPGKKILISGKTRCNLSNTKDIDSFVDMFGQNGRFLLSAFHQFFRHDLLLFLKRHGVDTKIENEGRVFPASDNAGDIVEALSGYLRENHVRTETGAGVKEIIIEDGRVTGVKSGSKTIPADAVILATGGASYPQTGSTGDGFKFAKDIGHTIIPLRPALVPLVVYEIERARSMQGVSFRNVRLTSFHCPADEIQMSMIPVRDAGRGIAGKKSRHPVIESRTGDLMITHFGLGGPALLLMSLSIVDALAKGPVSVSIDLFSELSEKELLGKLENDLVRFGKRSYTNLLKEILPHKIVDTYVDITGIPQDKRCNQITSQERDKLLNSLKSLRFNIKGPRSLASAMVTAGGVSLKEIDPRTMASLPIKGLYFCGEVMDIDAETGGFNLQAAFSTGWVAGKYAAAFSAEAQQSL
jgi:predicted flavoprotein YhiN